MSTPTEVDFKGKHFDSPATEESSSHRLYFRCGVLSSDLSLASFRATPFFKGPSEGLLGRRRCGPGFIAECQPLCLSANARMPRNNGESFRTHTHTHTHASNTTACGQVADEGEAWSRRWKATLKQSASIAELLAPMPSERCRLTGCHIFQRL